MNRFEKLVYFIERIGSRKVEFFLSKLFKLENFEFFLFKKI